MTPFEHRVEVEARGLHRMVRRGSETLESARRLIGIGRGLLERMRLNCIDAPEREAVEESVVFRSAVLLRFDVLAKETR